MTPSPTTGDIWYHKPSGDHYLICEQIIAPTTFMILRLDDGDISEYIFTSWRVQDFWRLEA